MPVALVPPDPADLHALAGVRLGIARACIRKSNRADLVVLSLADGASVTRSSRATAFAPHRSRSAARILRVRRLSSAHWS